MSLYDLNSVAKHILEGKQKKVFSHIERMKSSVRNKYCLYCRSEITEQSHHCKQIEGMGDQIVAVYFEMDEQSKKEILSELKNELLINEEFAQNIKNKILAYSL